MADDDHDGIHRTGWVAFLSVLSVAAVGVLVALVLVLTMVQGLRLLLEVLARV